MRDTILQLASQAKRKIVVAESCTGGMLAAALTDLPGSSAVFERGFVTYSNAAKIELLGVSADTLERHGAVSEPVAKDMARGALERSGGDIALSITGIAGPGGSEHKPEGRVCFGLAISGGAVTSETIEFGAKGRDAVRIAARDHALATLIQALQSH
ncbi:CinA family protein [Rhodobacteraceae bacterium nBUS_24]|jgi:nicotinamide-nucleotide amidase|nr:CinA family protein [Marinovum sp.]MDG1424238.1 CinA family protein [Paracoccaceae bacterium]MBT4871905.1 CinA family protein [Marinovum sp.]MBT6534440.1 CinA family protein [Marinovum sp.]MBT7908746.1 CinA family protein [Marinovum sp.]